MNDEQDNLLRSLGFGASGFQPCRALWQIVFRPRLAPALCAPGLSRTLSAVSNPWEPPVTNLIGLCCMDALGCEPEG